MKKTKTKIVVLGTALTLLVAGGGAQAATSWQSYNKNVPSFNGYAYSYASKQTGLHGNEEINVDHKSTGGSYVVDVRAERDKGVSRNTSWKRNVGDNVSWTWYRNIVQSGSASYYRLAFSNDVSTPVSVNVKGSFKSN
ncbi:hypothetical protein CHH58_13345 [Terribacillus saccharophilus]|uniref:hypothetical protein n=1 Tax=Terribacillus saccharophilus TaxID=361277 RepID=UPI000BA72651|nr:hypothetical protein [Terribacillus saccharophilus]PAF36231.1 hypothetical protein CHH58_13345 [Terribacillus saccharophilus]